MSTTILQKLNVWKNKFQRRIYGHDRENNPGGKSPNGWFVGCHQLEESTIKHYSYKFKE